MLKDMEFCHSEETYPANTKNNRLMPLHKTVLEALKTATEKLAHKAAEITRIYWLITLLIKL